MRDRDGDESIEEKPVLKANAGIYRVAEGVLNSPYRGVKPVQDMTDLIWDAYPVELSGYVLDIGTPQTYEAACARLSS